jgi:hypothetical protein
MNSVTRHAPDAQSWAERIEAALIRLERQLANFERLTDEGIGAFLNAKFPFGDHRTSDRWRRRP